MKKFNKVLSLVLAMIMVLSCISSAAAIGNDKIPAEGIAKNVESGRAEQLKGFQSPMFKEANTYQYADDEIVRAIVILETAPEADVAENGSTKAATHRVKLINEHNAVRKAMKGISYEVAHEFTALLNGFSCDVAYGDLEKIAAIDGVDAVHIANSYAAPVLEEPKNNASGNMTGNAYTHALYGNMGEGTVVAVLDTGLRTTHEAFTVYEDMLSPVITEADLSKTETKGAYISAKVPFAYDYADKDNDVSDNNGHGTHVSGTAVGYVVDEEGVIVMTGAAPAAQLLSMKIFKDAVGGTTSDIYFDALEDAYLLGADVVNMSIGAQNGFTYDDTLETEVYGDIYTRLDNAGIILSVSAGNEYSMAQYSSMGYIGPEYPDYGTVASPSTYSNNISIASVENYAYPQYPMYLGETAIPYTDSSEDLLWINTFGGKDVEYVVVTDAEGNLSLGIEEDYANVDVTGKVAVVSRGETTFEEKADMAYAKGAIGCIVVNNQDGVISMAIETFEIPAVSVQLSAKDALMNASEKVLKVSDKMETLENPTGWLMSDFSDWGTTPDLTMRPTITSVGGYVYSSVPTADDAYEIYSGTSMAAPNATGTFASVLSYLKEAEPELTKAERAEKAKAILISNATILYDADEYIYSPRKQGAGLANSFYAIDAHENGAYITDPIKELKDDPDKTGVYSFDVTLVNDTDKDVTYDTITPVVMIDYIANLNTEENPIIGNTLTSDYINKYCNVSYKEGSCYAASFTDCTANWYHEAVDYAVLNKLMNGISADKFDPSGSMTRGMIVTVLYREAGSPVVTAPATFTDVAQGRYYSNAIAWAQANGIVNGISETEFAPDAKVTREQIATILWRYAGKQAADADMSKFVDASSISNFAKEAMAWAVAEGIFKGDNTAKLNPTANATRAEFACMIMRFLNGSYNCSGIVGGKDITAVTVPANGTATVNVTITLNDEIKSYLDKIFANGTYIEGYVEFSNADNFYVHATYLAFYGDWTQAPVLEANDTMDMMEMHYLANTTAADEEGNTYADYGYTGYDFVEYYTDLNTAYLFDSYTEDAVSYLGANIYDLNTTEYMREHIAFTTEESDADYYWADGFYLMPYQLRNARHLIMTVSDKETGEIYYVDDTEYLPKAAYDEETAVWQAFGVFAWDGTDAEGNYVPSGTVAHVQFDAVLPYNDAEQKDVWSFDVTVDSTAPVIESVELKDDILTVTASDENYLAGIYLMDANYKTLAMETFSSDKKGESFTAELDVSELTLASVTLCVGDYATNETEQEVNLIEPGLPAKITYVTPAGSTTVDCLTADKIEIPGCEETYEGYEFECWATKSFEQSEDGSDTGAEFFYEGTEVIVAGDMTLYAVFAKGEVVAYEKPVYTMQQGGSYEGDYAIVGYDTNADYEFQITAPSVMTDTGKKAYVADFADGEISTTTYQFATAEPSIHYVIEKVEGDVYTVKNNVTGKYLAADGTEIAMVDEVTDMAKWIIKADKTYSFSSSMTNAGDSDLVLVYDDEAKEFAVYDNTVPYYGDYYPAEWFTMAIYARETEGFEIEYYTTVIK